MEHPLNNQYVLRCQLLYYKLCWSLYSYFISFIKLSFFRHHALLCVSKFVCQAAVMLIVALQAALQHKAFIRKEEMEEQETDNRENTGTMFYSLLNLTLQQIIYLHVAECF